MNREKYYQQVELLLEVLPLLNKFPAFALKGGTAINLFVRDMPRLSVDIDLCYLPIEPRNEFLINMTKLLNELADDIRKEYKVEVTPIYTNKDKQFSKLLISKENIDIKIEPNLTLRGSVYEPEVLSLCQAAQASFLQAIKINSLSLADLYGGKICAALDRQHPRDLFDIYMLYENQGLTNSIRQAFIIYLACSPRPMCELLSPNILDHTKTYINEFQGMTRVEIGYDKLISVLHKLIQDIKKSLTEKERQFLLSIKQGEPNYAALPIPDIYRLPALQWKLINIKNMDSKKHALAVDKLRMVLDL